MYSRNLAAFLGLLVKKGQLNIDMNDDIIRETLLTRDGKVVKPRIRDFFSLCHWRQNERYKDE